MREVCFLIGEGDRVLWADASDSPVALPDSRARWEAIWRHRAELLEIAHSHPKGPERFSQEDEETMAALVTALGRPLRFSVVTSAKTIVRSGSADEARTDEPWWAALMRLASGMSPEQQGNEE
jgi:hypothetical protein